MSSFKKLLKVALVGFTVFTSMPQDFVHAVEEEVHEHEHATLGEIQTEIDRILVEYLGSTNLSEEEVTDIVIEMDWLRMIEAQSAIEHLEEMMSCFTEEELNALIP